MRASPARRQSGPPGESKPIFLGTGFASLCLVFVLRYLHAARNSQALLLSAGELHETKTVAWFWSGACVIGLLSVLFAVLLPAAWLPFTGFVYMLLAAWGPAVGIHRGRRKPAD